MLGKLLIIGLLSLLAPSFALADIEEDIEGYLELDRRLRKLAYEKKWEDAIRMCDQEIAKDPNFFGGYDLRSWARLGELEQKHGPDFGQDKTLREQVQLDSIIADSNKAVQLSEAFEKRSKSTGASTTLDALYIEAKIYATRARARHHANDFNGAFADYLKANKLDLSSVEYAYGIGRARAMKEDLSNALLDFELARTIDNTYAPTYLERARVLARLGKSTEAITDFSRGIELIETHEIDDPVDIAPEQLATLSKVYGERAAAKRAARDSAGADQDLNRQRALLHEKDQRWEKARDEYSQLVKAGKTSRDQAHAFYSRARTQSRLGQLDQALHDADNAIELDAAPSYYSARAGIHRQKGDAARAIEDYSKALDLLAKQHKHPYWVGLVSRAEAYRENKQLDLALADLKAARDQNLGYRQNARKHGLHGLILMELGREREAADSLRYSRNNDEKFFEANIEPELDKIMEKRNLPSDPKAAKLAWELGKALGKAAFLSVQEGGSDKAKTALAGAAQYAKSLNVTVLALPMKGQSKEEDFRNALEYLKQSRNKVAQEIDKAHGRPAAMCLDLAMSSLTLQLVYQTNSPKLKGQLLDLIKRAGPQSGAPDQYWKPVVEKAEASAPFGEFTAAVRNMLENVTKHFATKSNAQPAEESKNLPWKPRPLDLGVSATNAYSGFLRTARRRWSRCRVKKANASSSFSSR